MQMFLKCKFFQPLLPYFGHVIGSSSMLIYPDCTHTIIYMPTHSNAKSGKKFLSVAQFCDRLVSDFFIIAAPLHEVNYCL